MSHSILTCRPRWRQCTTDGEFHDEAAVTPRPGRSIEDVDARPITGKSGKRFQRATSPCQKRLARATTRTFRPLTRTSSDRRRSPRVSLISRSRRLRVAASVLASAGVAALEPVFASVVLVSVRAGGDSGGRSQKATEHCGTTPEGRPGHCFLGRFHRQRRNRRLFIVQ